MSVGPTARLCIASLAALMLSAPGLADDDPSLVATWRGGRLTRQEYESWRSFHELADNPQAIREQVFVESFAALGRERGVEGELRTRLELEAMRQQVLLPVLHRHVVADVTVSDEEIEAFRRDHPDAFRRPRKLRLRSIYKELPAADARATRARMEEIHRQLLDGADFKQLARRESESQTRFRDGLVGYLAPEDLPQEVAAAVRGLQPGAVSAIVEHSGGLSIFLCEEVREAQIPTPDEVRAKLRTSLLRWHGRERWKSFQQDLLASAAPRIELPKAGTPGATVLAMEGYRMSAEALAELVALRYPDKALGDLTTDRLEELLRSWALGIAGVRRAVELGLDKDPEAAAALRWRSLDILAHRELVRRIDGRLEEPTTDELRRRFAANPGRFQEPASYQLAVIHFGAKEGEDPQQRLATARDVARRLAAGELTFEAAARRYSTDPSAADGGFVGWRSGHQLAVWGPIARKAVGALQPGQHTDLLSLESGLWIFELRDFRDARPSTFEAAEDRLREELRRQQIKALEQTVREEHLEEIGLTLLETGKVEPNTLPTGG